MGITSTPVIDPDTGTVYVVAEVGDGHGNVTHKLEGLSVATGAVTLSENVDPPLPSGERPAQLLQRASLALGNGRVYISYGGNDGDCGTYNGWVVGVKETGPPTRSASRSPRTDTAARSGSPAARRPSTRLGTSYVTTGNANPDPPEGGPDPKKYTESVVELSADLTPIASYKDRVAGGDEDLATGNPVLLPDGNLFAVGKTDIGFVLRQSDLSQVAAIDHVCGSDPDGGPAYDQVTNRMFVPCRGGGIQIVDLSTRHARTPAVRSRQRPDRHRHAPVGVEPLVRPRSPSSTPPPVACCSPSRSRPARRSSTHPARPLDCSSFPPQPESPPCARGVSAPTWFADGVRLKPFDADIDFECRDGQADGGR